MYIGIESVIKFASSTKVSLVSVLQLSNGAQFLKDILAATVGFALLVFLTAIPSIIEICASK